MPYMRADAAHPPARLDRAGQSDRLPRRDDHQRHVVDRSVVAGKLIDSGLDLIWVSIDGATPESYSDVRLGAELPNVLHNLNTLRHLRGGGDLPKPEIGVAFVAMERNIADLPEVLKIAQRHGAMHFRVSNVLAIDEQPRRATLRKRRQRYHVHLVGFYAAPQSAQDAIYRENKGRAVQSL